MRKIYKVIILSIVGFIAILFVPPNIAGFACNEMNIHDDSICYIVGMKFFGVYFITNIWSLYAWEDPIPCGGFSAEPGKTYTCSKPMKYWGF